MLKRISLILLLAGASIANAGWFRSLVVNSAAKRVAPIAANPCEVEAFDNAIDDEVIHPIAANPCKAEKYENAIDNEVISDDYYEFLRLQNLSLEESQEELKVAIAKLKEQAKELNNESLNELVRSIESNFQVKQPSRLRRLLDSAWSLARKADAKLVQAGEAEIKAVKVAGNGLRKAFKACQSGLSTAAYKTGEFEVKAFKAAGNGIKTTAVAIGSDWKSFATDDGQASKKATVGRAIAYPLFKLGEKEAQFASWVKGLFRRPVKVSTENQD